MAKAAKVQGPAQEDLVDKLHENPEPVAKHENPEPELEVEAAEVETPDSPPEEDASALRQQIEAQNKALQLEKERNANLRREAEEAHRLAAENAAKVVQGQKNEFKSRLETTNELLNIANSEMEAAKREKRTAIERQDFDTYEEASDRYTRAMLNIQTLQVEKAGLESAPPPEEPRAPQFPVRVESWIKRVKPDAYAWNKLRANHDELIRQGIDFDSEEYLEKQEDHLISFGVQIPGRRVEAQEEPIVAEKPATRVTPPVSAPVSREAPSTTGASRSDTIRLSAAEVEAARMAGITPKEYARQKQKMLDAKANGMYTGGQ